MHPKFCFLSRKPPRIRIKQQRARRWFEARCCELRFSPPEESVADAPLVQMPHLLQQVDWTSSPNTIWDWWVWQTLPLFPRPLHPPSNLLSARRLPSIDFLASGFRLGLLKRERWQQISGMEEREKEVFVPPGIPPAVSQRDDYNPPQRSMLFSGGPSTHPSLYFRVLLIASCIQT